MIKKLPNGKYRLESKSRDERGRRKNLGTFNTLEEAKKQEQNVQFFKQQNKR